MRPQREKLINVAQALVTVASSLLESLQAETAETECSETVPAKAAAAESSEEDFEIVPPSFAIGSSSSGGSAGPSTDVRFYCVWPRCGEYDAETCGVYMGPYHQVYREIFRVGNLECVGNLKFRSYPSEASAVAGWLEHGPRKYRDKLQKNPPIIRVAFADSESL